MNIITDNKNFVKARLEDVVSSFSTLITKVQDETELDLVVGALTRFGRLSIYLDEVYEALDAERERKATEDDRKEG